jgi:hypothetical protein
MALAKLNKNILNDYKLNKEVDKYLSIKISVLGKYLKNFILNIESKVDFI